MLDSVFRNSLIKADIEIEYNTFSFTKTVVAKYKRLANADNGLSTSHSFCNCRCIFEDSVSEAAIAILLAFVSFKEFNSC